MVYPEMTDQGCATRTHSQRIVARGSVFGEEGFALLTLGKVLCERISRDAHWNSL